MVMLAGRRKREGTNKIGTHRIRRSCIFLSASSLAITARMCRCSSKVRCVRSMGSSSSSELWQLARDPVPPGVAIGAGLLAIATDADGS